MQPVRQRRKSRFGEAVERTDPEDAAVSPMRVSCTQREWSCRVAGTMSLKPTGRGLSRTGAYCPTCPAAVCPFGYRSRPDNPYLCDPYPGIRDWIPLRVAARIAGVGRTALNEMALSGGLLYIIAGHVPMVRVSLGQVKAKYAPTMSDKEARAKCGMC